MPRIKIPVRAFVGMNPQKGAHLLQVDPETGVIEPLEIANAKPQSMPNLEPRKVLEPIIMRASVVAGDSHLTREVQ